MVHFQGINFGGWEVQKDELFILPVLFDDLLLEVAFEVAELHVLEIADVGIGGAQAQFFFPDLPAYLFGHVFIRQARENKIVLMIGVKLQDIGMVGLNIFLPVFCFYDLEKFFVDLHNVKLVFGAKVLGDLFGQRTRTRTDFQNLERRAVPTAVKPLFKLGNQVLGKKFGAGSNSSNLLQILKKIKQVFQSVSVYSNFE